MTSAISLYEYARSQAVTVAAEARASLSEEPPILDRKTGLPVPRFYQVESFRTGTPPGWWRPVGVAPKSQRLPIRRSPDAWVLVELVWAPHEGPFWFHLSELEALSEASK